MSAAAASAKAHGKRKNQKKKRAGGGIAGIKVSPFAAPAPEPWTHDEDDSTGEGGESDNEDYSDTNEERAKEYRRGGYHPVTVGELYNHGRYRIVHKLGWGYFSTVWLAWDYDKAFADPCPRLDKRCLSDPAVLRQYTGDPRVKDNLDEPALKKVAHSPTALLSDSDAGAGTDPDASFSVATADKPFGGRQRGGWAAVKFQKSAKRYGDAAQDEIRLLSRLSTTALETHNSASPTKVDRDLLAPCCRLYDHFVHDGQNGRHFCMVFDVLGENLLQPIIGTKYRGLASAWDDGVAIVKRMAAQLLRGLDHAHRVAQVLHTDVKPENILFVAPPPKVQKVIREYDPPDRDTIHVRIVDRDPTTLSTAQWKKVKGMVKAGKLSQEKFDEMRAAREAKGKAKQADSAKPADDAKPAADGDAPKDGDATEKPDGEVADAVAATSVAKPDEADAAADAPRAKTPEELLQACFAISRGEAVDESGENQYAAGKRPAHVINGAVAVADFGNACWLNLQYTEEVQTRQYRSPEVIIGAGYGTAIDVWSVACVIFELLTGEFLFEPKGPSDGSDAYSRDDDHLALIMELVGAFPPHMSTHQSAPFPADRLAYWIRTSTREEGPYPFSPAQGMDAIAEAESRTQPADLLAPQPTDAPLLGASPHGYFPPRQLHKFFDQHGNLRNINGLKSWSLFNVLTDKYGFSPLCAREITSFLVPMLHPDPRCRPSASQMLRHPWLTVRTCDVDGSAKREPRRRGDPPTTLPPSEDVPWWANFDWTFSQAQLRAAAPPPQLYQPPMMAMPFDIEFAATNHAWCNAFYEAVLESSRRIKVKEPLPPEDGAYTLRRIHTYSTLYNVKPDDIPIPMPAHDMYNMARNLPPYGMDEYGSPGEQAAFYEYADDDLDDDRVEEDLEEDDFAQGSYPEPYDAEPVEEPEPAE